MKSLFERTSSNWVRYSEYEWKGQQTVRHKPAIIWDFHSLMPGVQMMFSFMLTDKDNPIRLCKHCSKPFVAKQTQCRILQSPVQEQAQCLQEQGEG